MYQKTMILMRGSSGSGKSYAAREIVRARGAGKILSSDDYFIGLNGLYHFNLKNLSKSHEWNRKRCESAMQVQENLIIIDNTNTQAWEMKGYVQLAKAYNYEIEFLEPTTQWWLERNLDELLKMSQHGVDRETMVRMIKRFEVDVSVEHIMAAKRRQAH